MITRIAAQSRAQFLLSETLFTVKSNQEHHFSEKPKLRTSYIVKQFSISVKVGFEPMISANVCQRLRIKSSHFFHAD